MLNFFELMCSIFRFIKINTIDDIAALEPFASLSPSVCHVTNFLTSSGKHSQDWFASSIFRLVAQEIEINQREKGIT